MGDGTAVSKTGADLLGNRKFESISLLRRVRCELNFRGRIPSMTVAISPTASLGKGSSSDDLG
jgi:hypothetical protein